MARRKGNAQKVDKLPLSEIKAQSGKYLFVNYRGVDKGGWQLPAPRPRFAGDVVEELFIMQFAPKQIGEEWLDDPRFMALYESVPGIEVWKSDIFPPKLDLTLPNEIESRLNQTQTAMAYLVASSPYTESMRDVIQTQDRESADEEVIRKNRQIVLPFLKAVQFYETRLMNRPEVLRDIKVRLEKILNEKPVLETIEAF